MNTAVLTSPAPIQILLIDLRLTLIVPPNEPPPGSGRRQHACTSRRSASASGGSASSMQDRQVGFPWADGCPILLRHHTSDLRQMTKIVRDPRREELLERDAPEGRMLAAEQELRRRQVERAQVGDILRPQLAQLGEELIQRATLVA